MARKDVCFDSLWVVLMLVGACSIWVGYPKLSQAESQSIKVFVPADRAPSGPASPPSGPGDGTRGILWASQVPRPVAIALRNVGSCNLVVAAEPLNPEDKHPNSITVRPREARIFIIDYKVPVSVTVRCPSRAGKCKYQSSLYDLSFVYSAR
jgi:hypothetical protein